MKLLSIILSSAALFGGFAFAVPAENLQVRSSCQVGEIWGGGDAACSASCISQGEGVHGGYCDDKSVCHCTH